MTAEISGEKVVCRGVVHRLKEDKTALQAETETFGGAMKPLYVLRRRQSALRRGEREADCGRRDVPRFICRGKKRDLRGVLRARGAGKGGKR